MKEYIKLGVGIGIGLALLEMPLIIAVPIAMLICPWLLGIVLGLAGIVLGLAFLCGMVCVSWVMVRHIVLVILKGTLRERVRLLLLFSPLWLFIAIVGIACIVMGPEPEEVSSKAERSAMPTAVPRTMCPSCRYECPITHGPTVPGVFYTCVNCGRLWVLEEGINSFFSLRQPTEYERLLMCSSTRQEVERIQATEMRNGVRPLGGRIVPLGE
jgi:hypothetical protein